MKLKRRDARILTMKALFAWEFSEPKLEELLKFCWLDETFHKSYSEKELAFPRLLISGTLENLTAIDEKICKYLRGWEFSRINKVDKAILRFSVYSLLFQKDIHPSIVIDEAVSIAHEYGDDDSFKFVNAVLDNIRKELECEKE
ncbi:MAG: transcription antitermination factor NusB [Treponemataceae bacterium]